MQTLEAILYDNGKGGGGEGANANANANASGGFVRLQILDQLKLPHSHEHLEVKDVEQGWKVIKDMNVRGAPAIAIVGCLSLAVELQRAAGTLEKESPAKLAEMLRIKLDYLETSRPTAVNLKRACDDIRGLIHGHLQNKDTTTQSLLQSVVDYSERLFKEDEAVNKAMGKFGAEDIIKRAAEKAPDRKQLQVLTHCNTGSLATSGYGTALGVVRCLHDQGCLEKAFCTETRPYNQGSRLTAYELVYDKIPACLICDDMAGALMKTQNLSAVVVGADRVARNGDTANKIGTYQLAVLAKHHGVPFYVACPTTTLDMHTGHGDLIPIEERRREEMMQCGCKEKNMVPPKDIACWNPAFDVTPAELITGGIITEFGVHQPPLDTTENLAKLKMAV